MPLYFPTGRTDEQCRKDAKRLSRTEGIPHREALDRISKDNSNGAWSWAFAMKVLPLLQDIITDAVKPKGLDIKLLTDELEALSVAELAEGEYEFLQEFEPIQRVYSSLGQASLPDMKVDMVFPATIAGAYLELGEYVTPALVSKTLQDKSIFDDLLARLQAQVEKKSAFVETLTRMDLYWKSLAPVFKDTLKMTRVLEVGTRGILRSHFYDVLKWNEEWGHIKKVRKVRSVSPSNDVDMAIKSHLEQIEWVAANPELRMDMQSTTETIMCAYALDRWDLVERSEVIERWELLDDVQKEAVERWKVASKE